MDVAVRMTRQLQQQADFQPVCRYFDEGIGFRGMRKLDRRRRSNFEFVREGQFQKEAEIARIRVSALYISLCGSRTCNWLGAACIMQQQDLVVKACMQTACFESLP